MKYVSSQNSRVVNKPGEYWLKWMVHQRCQIALQNLSTAQAMGRKRKVRPRKERVQLHFEVRDVDAEYERLKSAGVDFKEPPQDMPWRWRHAYTNDPAGHTVEICSPLPDAKDKDAEFIRGTSQSARV
jgi:uncharacterized glyoxalase superfamily protein PhnB